MRWLSLALLLCACSTPDDTETGDTGGVVDDRRNQAQQCQHGGYLDAWFPKILVLTQTLAVSHPRG